MKKLLANVWLRVCPVRPIYVRFSPSHGWTPALAYFGVYYPYWWAGKFPLRLTLDGCGIILRGGLVGTGRPYPYFSWCPRNRVAAR